MENIIAPLVSVIIPVFNDTPGLKLCLAALADQTYPSSCFEVIVVDNGSAAAGAIKSLVSSHAGVVLTQELVPGSYAARNRGIALARGEIIAFTDADCIPAPNWLQAGVQAFIETSNCGLVAGQIKLFFQHPHCPTAVELYESIRALPQQEFVEKGHYGATANVFTSRQVFNAVGLFDSTLKSSGDMEWGQRVYAQGYAQVYAEAALVHHPTHDSWRDFCTRTRRLAGGHYDLQMKQAKSYWQRQIVFWRAFITGLTPPVFFAIHTLLDPRLQRMGQKIRVAWMMVIVRYLTAWETLRLKLGGVSSRV